MVMVKAVKDTRGQNSWQLCSPGQPKAKGHISHYVGIQESFTRTLGNISVNISINEYELKRQVTQTPSRKVVKG